MRKCAEKEYEPVFIPEADKPENNPEKTSADSNTEQEEKTETEKAEEPEKETPKVKPVFVDML